MKTLHLLLIALSSCALNAADDKPSVHWDTASADSAVIAVPKEWRSFDGLEPTMLIYRQGDGIGVPTVDENGAPVQIGLTVEKFPRDEMEIEAIAKEIAMGASLNPDLKLVGHEKFEAIVLSDGSKAALTTSEFIKTGSRRSFYMKLVTKSDIGEVWVVTGYLVAGRDSEWPTQKSSLAGWLRAHVVSLTVSGKDVDRKTLEDAYFARQEQERVVPRELVAPSFDITGMWNGVWQESGQGSTEAFTMELVQTGATVKGTAVFMDSTRTRTTVQGEASGTEIRLVFTPLQPSAPKTTWTGTVADQAITGRWYLNAHGVAATGSWAATADCNGVQASAKDRQ